MISKKIFFSKHSYPKGKAHQGSQNERKKQTGPRLPEMQKLRHGARLSKLFKPYKWARILDFLLQNTETCLLFPGSTKQSLGFKKTECICTEHNPFSKKETMGLIKKDVPQQKQVVLAVGNEIKEELKELREGFEHDDGERTLGRNEDTFSSLVT
ncbi:uncharacterized protein LOC126933952 [Macaca thibetana thibetana]|uniref:uncharacterized protein LOC126933952 n=1 Tax=Macaca thibetana thibetana TaxID=257877 RepID=UPI0021BC9130|nr:uncharacterized protein LOC126933952 [Macaca thibetana thibetana]